MSAYDQKFTKNYGVKICVRNGVLHFASSEECFTLCCRYDITDALHDAHISPEDVFNAQLPFSLKVEIHAVNGSALPASSISAPTIIFEPAHGACAASGS